MEHIQQQPEQQHEILRKRSDLLNDDSDEKELSTDNSYVSLERLNSTPLHVPCDNPALPFSSELPSASPNAVSISVSQETAKCRYCDASHPKELLANHQEKCEMRSINCEACGEMVEIDIFDFHLEICANRVDPYAIYQNFANYQEFTYANGEFVVDGEENVQAQQQPGESLNQVEEDENQQGEQEEQDIEDVGDEEEYDDDEFDPDTMTYEQLIYLDNFVVKKGMSAEEIAKMPVEVHSNEVDGSHSCTVCISEYEDGESLRKLPCGHKFHVECIDTWMDSNITCPICKKFLR